MKKNSTTYSMIGAFIASIILFTTAQADAPTWWTERGVINTNLPTQNRAAANHGQLKWIATKAAEEFAEKLPAVDRSAIATRIATFTTNNHYEALNIGQLKYVVQPFYDVMQANGLSAAWPAEMISGPYPWSAATNAPQNSAMANIGQLKYVFSFALVNLTLDTDNDGIPDCWEVEHGFNPSNSDDALHDADEDGLSNEAEFRNETLPRIWDTDGDGLWDGFEVDNRFNPVSEVGNSEIDIDTDKDGLPDPLEYLFFFNLSQSATNDFDGDGLLNNEELVFGLGQPIAIEFEWVPASATTNVIDWQKDSNVVILVDSYDGDDYDPDDEGAIEVNLGFEFPLFGEYFSHAYIGVNGTLSFGSPFGSYNYLYEPPPTNYPSYIAPFWTDMEIVDGQVYWQMETNGLSPRFLVTWSGVSFFGIPDSELTFQAELSPSGTVAVRYKVVDAAGDTNTSPVMVSMIEGSGGTNALFWAFEEVAPGSLTNQSAVFFGINGTFHLKSYPHLVDSDQDNIDDQFETESEFLDPLNPDDGGADFDGDGLVNSNEYLVGTDMNDPDTDKDRLGDFDEFMHRNDVPDPLNPTSVSPHASDMEADSDNDGMTNGYELDYRFLDPFDPSDAAGDEDGDGLLNGEEYTIGTSPDNPDTDGDLLGDYDELLHMNDVPDPLDPVHALESDMLADSDDDGMPNGYELAFSFLDPFDPSDAGYDSDMDGMPDALELAYFSNLTQSAIDDFDGDGLLNVEEIKVSDYIYFKPLEIKDSWIAHSDLVFQVDWGESSVVSNREHVFYPAGMGFSFPFYGESYSNLYIGSDGYVKFTDRLITNEVSLLPIIEEIPLVAPFWGSFSGEQMDVRYACIGAAPDRVFVISWEYLYAEDGNGIADFQSILHEDGRIIFNYKKMYGDSASLYRLIYGLQRGDGKSSSDVFDGEYPPDNRSSSFLFMPAQTWEFVSNPARIDTDGDGVPDNIELESWGYDPLDPYDGNPDADDDGLFNYLEIEIGTDLDWWDTDEDGLSDWGEYQYMNDLEQPLDPLTNRLVEMIYDTDVDGMPNGYEISNFLDPFDPSDSSQDYDEDGLKNHEEYLLGTRPNYEDHDNDTYPDGMEVEAGMSPFIQLTTSDMSNPDWDKDADGDGLSNRTEVENFWGDPMVPNGDFDGDGLTDYEEYSWGYSSPATNEFWCGMDTDGDGLTGYQECKWGSCPTNNHTDSDGVDDGEEVTWQCDPTNSLSYPVSVFGKLSPVVELDGEFRAGVVTTNIIRTASSPSNDFMVAHVPTLVSYAMYAFQDHNANGVMDDWELQGYTNLTVTGLVFGCDIELLEPDNDMDGIPDWWEVMVCGGDIDPDDDIDYDGLSNLSEYQLKTNPRKYDTDGDNTADGVEVAADTSPTNHLSVPSSLRGQVINAETQEGTLKAVASLDAICWPVSNAVKANEWGIFEIHGLHSSSNYYLKAYIDLNENGVWETGEPLGECADNPVPGDRSEPVQIIISSHPGYDSKADSDGDGISDLIESLMGGDFQSAGQGVDTNLITQLSIFLPAE